MSAKFFFHSRKHVFSSNYILNVFRLCLSSAANCGPIVTIVVLANARSLFPGKFANSIGRYIIQSHPQTL